MNLETAPDLAALLDQLDGLWARHLNLLDQYQNAQKNVQQLLSAGHLSLAQANFKSSTRRSYGRDYYDQRMKASRLCDIVSEDGYGASSRVSVRSIAASTHEIADADKETAGEPKQQPSPPATPAPDAPDDGEEEGAKMPSAQSEKQEPASRPAAPPQDPLRWFGILIARELRSTQTSFSAAVEAPMIDAVNAARGMRETDAEIRKLREAVKKAEKAAAA